MAEETKKEGGFLSRTFNWVASAFKPENLFRFALTTCVGIATGLWIGGFEDLFYFPAIHNPSPTVMATGLWAQENLGWIHEWTGFTGNGGALNSAWWQSVIEPFMGAATPPDAGALTEMAQQQAVLNTPTVNTTTPTIDPNGVMGGI